MPPPTVEEEEEKMVFPKVFDLDFLFLVKQLLTPQKIVFRARAFRMVPPTFLPFPFHIVSGASASNADLLTSCVFAQWPGRGALSQGLNKS